MTGTVESVHTENNAPTNSTENPNETINTENSPVHTENTEENYDNEVTGTTESTVHTENQVTTENKEDDTDWEKLMINSADSLFEEMTKQMDINNITKGTTPTQTNHTNEQIESTEKLPDLVKNNKDAVTGLLMLGVNGNIRPEDDLAIDQEVNNEELLPVGAPKLPDFAKEMSESRNIKNPKKPKSSKGNTDDTKSINFRKSTRTTKTKTKHRILPDTESSSTDTPKSPSSKLIITRHRLKRPP